jgi:hypothetical protein
MIGDAVPLFLPHRVRTPTGARPRFDFICLLTKGGRPRETGTFPAGISIAIVGLLHACVAGKAWQRWLLSLCRC